LEKNEIINMGIHPHVQGAEYLRIRNVPHRTVTDLISNTERMMGGKFIPYSAYNNNCQDFILAVLQSNGIHEGFDFVKQDTKSIFENHPNLRKFANTVTDVAGRVNNVFQGGEIKPNKRTNGMTGDQIMNILGNRIEGVFSKDMLPPRLRNHRWYVVNMQNHDDGNGTHWVCCKGGSPLAYFDPFGITPPVEIMELAKGNILFSNKQIQDINSTTCGWYVCACILSDSAFDENHESFKDFLDSFSEDTKTNDYILKKKFL
jgi:hypothetical protein